MPAADDEREWQTRKRRIDPRLDALGWKRSSSAPNRAYRTEEHPTEHGPADARRYGELSEAALCHASRPDLRPNRQVDLLVETLERLTA